MTNITLSAFKTRLFKGVIIFLLIS